MITVGTHDGQFHCDEALACGMLQILYPDMRIVRSRERAVLDTCDIVVDVGSVYDPETLRFDHHQRGFDVLFGPPSEAGQVRTVLSSAGLVYKHFGRQLLHSLYPALSEALEQHLFRSVYYGFVHHIDAIDNGVDVAVPGVQPSSLLSGRVRRMNRVRPFEAAVALCRDEFVEYVTYYVDQCVAAMDVIQEALAGRHAFHPSGRVVKIRHWVPWETIFHDVEDTAGIPGAVDFVVYRAKTMWRVMCVRAVRGQYAPRRPLAERYRGLHAEQLKALSGRDDLLFVHAGGFTGGARTLAGVMHLIETA